MQTEEWGIKAGNLGDIAVRYLAQKLEDEKDVDSIDDMS